MRRAGAVAIVALVLATLFAPWLTPHDPGAAFQDRSYAPPMRVRVVDDEGRVRAPFIYPLRLVNRLERRYAEDRTRPVALTWFTGGVVARAGDERAGPWLPLGADSLGRDVFARLVYGGRLSLGVAVVATLGALLLGMTFGGLAGLAGGWIDESLMRLSDFVLVLPAMYVVLALRASLPLVLSSLEVFPLMAGILALVGWPIVARGVRAIVAAERRRDYAQAAIAAGAGPGRLLVRHLLPAARGFLGIQATLLLPAFILAEATLSFVGLGFPDPATSWGSMLQEAASVAALSDAPWTLAPAAAIVAVTISVNLVVQAPALTSTPGFGKIRTSTAGGSSRLPSPARDHRL